MRNSIKLLILTFLITPFLLGTSETIQDEPSDENEIVALKSLVTGEFIRAIAGKRFYLQRTGTEIEPWHKFKLIKLGRVDEYTTQVALKSEFSDKYVGIKSVENPVLVAKSSEIGENEKFVLYDLGGNRVALDSVPLKKFVRVYEGNNRNLIADSRSTDERETFEIVKPGLESLLKPQDEPIAEGSAPSSGGEESDGIEVSEGVESEMEPEGLSDPASDEYGIDEGIENRIEPESEVIEEVEPAMDAPSEMDSPQAPIIKPAEPSIVDIQLPDDPSSPQSEMDSPQAPIIKPAEPSIVDIRLPDDPSSPQSESENMVLPEKVALLSMLSNKYVRAGVGSESLLSASSDHIKEWETFRLRGKWGLAYALQSEKSGKYVRASGGSGSVLAASGMSFKEAEKFKIVRLENGNIAFLSTIHNKYLRAGVGKYSYLAFVSDHIEGWETFKLIDLSSD